MHCLFLIQSEKVIYQSLHALRKNFMKKMIILFSLMLASLTSWSFTPESGLYWNADEPGSGYTFEIQDNFFFGVFYVYDDLGLPFWYTTSGFLDGNSFVEADIFISEDGPCLACPYTPNSTFDSNLGKARINFLTETTATIDMLGQTLFVERFNFFLGDELQKMRGEWQVVLDLSEYTNDYPFSADALVFEQTETFDGDDLVTGCRSESTVFYIGCTDNANFYNSVAASVIGDQLLIVVDDSDSHFLTYIVDVGTNQFDGTAHYYRKNSNFDPITTNESGYTVRGFRSTSKSFINSGVGPNKSGATKSAGAKSLNLPETNIDFSAKKDSNKALKNLRKKLEQYLIQKRTKKNTLK